MYTSLYQYLLLNKRVPLPGIGSLVLEQQSPVVNFPEKKLEAPVYSISLTPADTVPGRAFFAWLGEALGIQERDAVIRFNDFAFDLRQQIRKGVIVQWEGVGKLSKDLAGNVKLDPVAARSPAHAVHAGKLVRDKAIHTVRVGEDERSSGEMELLLNQPAEQKDYWWAWALIIAVAAFSYIGWHFSVYGLAAGTAKNSRQLPAQEQPHSLYRQLQ